MATKKHFYGFKLLSDYQNGELKSYYDINPHSDSPFREKDALQYVMVEFAEKLNGSVDDRNPSRFNELVDKGWILFEDAAKANTFLHQDEDKPAEYTPTGTELGK
jgi:hypothetical protein